MTARPTHLTAEELTTSRRSLLPTKFRVPDGDFLVRRRVLDALEPTLGRRLVLLVAPAGSGKTTALAQFAHTTNRLVAWYRAERTESEPADLLRHLEYAVSSVVPDIPGAWYDVETAVRQLAAVRSAPPSLVVIDDLHELQHSAAEAVLESLVTNLPPWLTFHAATRHEPAFNLPRLRVSGLTSEVPSDALRWRPWEVERLFRDVYRQRLRPEDAARLTQRTEGWAAGLQLFHLATRELSTGDHRQLIDDLHTRPGSVRSYLTRNVISRLPAETQEFLVDTCVLGRVLPDLCDELRGRNDGLGHLTDLTNRRLFTLPCEDGYVYRYHEVLRSYLEVSLLQRDGPKRTKSRFALAGKLLEGAGWTAEAVQAYVRAEAWPDVDRVLGTDGATLAAGLAGPGLQRLPERLLVSDPWLQLAWARGLWRDGRLTDAVGAYRTAEAAFGDIDAAQLCRAERTDRQCWVDPQQRPTDSAIGLLRQATQDAPRDVLARATDTGGLEGLLVGAIAAMLTGDLRLAASLASDVGAEHQASHSTLACATVVEHLATTEIGQLDRSRLHGSADTLEHLGWTWVSRLLRLVADLMGGDGEREVRAFCVASELRGDRWGSPLAKLAGGIAAALRGREGHGWLREAADEFRALRAGVLQVWAEAWAALCAETEPDQDPKAAAERTRSLARRLGVTGAETVADLARAQLAGDHSGERAARVVAHDLGLALPAGSWRPPPTAALRPPRSAISCFAGLRVSLDGTDLDLSGLKPRVRHLLARLACPPDTLVGREVLVENLWPDTSSDGAYANLQVAVSTLRRFLLPDGERGDQRLLERADEAYVLRLPPNGRSDVATFDAAVDAALRARRRVDRDAELAALQEAFDAYQGDLLPELGNCEWVIQARARYQSEFAQVAQRLAEHRLAVGDPEAAIEIAEAGLRADRYRTRLWRSLATAYRRLGDPAAAARVAQEYDAVREDIGLSHPLN